MTDEIIDGKLWEHCIWFARLAARHLREMPDPETNEEMPAFRAQLELLDTLLSAAAKDCRVWWDVDALHDLNKSLETGFDLAGAAATLDRWADSLEGELRKLGWFDTEAAR